MPEGDRSHVAAEELFGLIKAYAEALAIPLAAHRRVLGFGEHCGAILGQFSPLVDAGNIYSATFDVNEPHAGPGSRDRLYAQGRLPYACDTFDAIVVPSTLMHMPEAAQAHWSAELGRVARPGCLLTAVLAAIVAAPTPPPLAGPDRTPSVRDLQRAYERGEFVYVPAPTPDPARPDSQGNAYVPVAYIRRRWRPPFELRDAIDDADRYAQAIAFLQHA